MALSATLQHIDKWDSIMPFCSYNAPSRTFITTGHILITKLLEYLTQADQGPFFSKIRAKKGKIKTTFKICQCRHYNLRK